jgi:hypothetical protein
MSLYSDIEYTNYQQISQKSVIEILKTTSSDLDFESISRKWYSYWETVYIYIATEDIYDTESLEILRELVAKT